jgi:WD40 repeat protein
LATSFHVFLSHSRADKPAVEELARRLAKEGIQAWLDKWHLIPGNPWQPDIEKALGESETCAVFVGPSGFGPWQNEEMRAAIDRCVRDSGRRFRVIPVLLPGAVRGERSSLPTFLAATTWVEFRDSLDDGDAFHRLVCGIRGVEPGPGAGRAIYEGQCPYRGLRVFDVGDSAFFFGREALVQWLLNEVRPATQGQAVNRFLAIVGASGSGKSSVARAGLVAALNRDDLPGSSRWPVAIFRPGVDPLESLAVALSRAVNVGQGAPALAELIAEFQKNEKTLHLVARQTLPEDAPDLRVVALVDQFEEVFTLCPKEDLREALIRNLLYAAKVAQGQTLVILTMRADFYAKCAPNADLAAALSDHHCLVGPMTEDELRQAIERPTQLVGCELEGGLVDLLLQDVRRQPGALPMLQHALLELWHKRDGRRLTGKGYQEIGRLEGALQRRADATLLAFSKEQQELCRRTFLRLTQPGEGTEDTKRRASMQELLSLSGTSSAEEAIVQKLADASLLTTEADLTHKDAFVEVAHEALIRSWPQLRKWIDADRAGLRTRIRLTEAARDWKNAGGDPAYLYTGARLAVANEWENSHPGELSADEAEFLSCSLETQQQREASELEAARRTANKLRRRAFVTAGAAGVALILLVVSVFLWRKSELAAGKAEEQARIAAIQRNAAEEQTRIAESRRLAAESFSALTKYPQRSLLLAVEAVKVEQSLHGVRVAADEQSLREALDFIGGRLVARADGPITTVAISADNRWLVTGSWDKTARLWDLSAKDPAGNPVVLRGHEGPIWAVAISADNHRIITGSEDKTVRLWDLSTRDPAANPVVLHGHEGPVWTVAISADNHWLVTCSEDRTARLWDLSAKDPAANPVVLRGHDGPVRAVAISTDNRWLITGSEDKTARFWDLSAKDPAANPVILRGHEGAVSRVAISADNRRLVTCSEDKTVRLWDLSAKDPAANPVVLRGHEGAVSGVAISADNHWLVTCSWDNTARLWDLSAKDPAANPVVLRGHDEGVSGVAVSSDSRWLVTCGYDKTARLWDLSAKDPAANPVVLRGHDGPVRSVAISTDNRWLITGSWDKTARFWDLSTKDPAANRVILRGHNGSVKAVAITSDSRWLVTGSLDKTARLWDLTAKDPAANPVVLRGHNRWVSTMAISQDNRWLVTGSWDKTARLWDLGAKDPAANPVILRGHNDAVCAVAISTDNRRLVTGSNDNTARLWDLSAKDPAANSMILHGHEGPVCTVAISADNRWLVTGSYDKTARLWDLGAKDPAANSMILRGHEGPVYAVAISMDNRRLVTASWDNTARLWDLGAKDPAASPIVLRGHKGPVCAVGISADARWLVTGSNDNTARLWDLSAKNPAANPIVLRGHNGWVRAVAISADNRWLITGSNDNTARLWDLGAKDPAASPVVLRGHEGPVCAVAISADAHWLATGGEENTARLWLLQMKDLIGLARTIVGRNFFADEWQLYFPGEKYRKTFPDLPGAD